MKRLLPLLMLKLDPELGYPEEHMAFSISLLLSLLACRYTASQLYLRKWHNHLGLEVWPRQYAKHFALEVESSKDIIYLPLPSLIQKLTLEVSHNLRIL